MKSFLLGCLMMFGFTLGANAQATPRVKTDKIKTPTVQCDMCKQRIEKYLSSIDGVQTVRVDYRRKETTVKYLTDRTNIEELKTHIANAGYDAEEITANEDSYKKLPSCCKKPEDRPAEPSKKKQ